MPLIDLARINYQGVSQSSNFYIGSIVNSSSGPKELKIISNELDLDTYYPNLTYREGYLKLLNSGANLVLKRINNKNTRLATLRLTSNEFLRYVYPTVYDSIDYTPRDDNDFESGILIDPIGTNNILNPLDLYPGNMIPISGIIYGSFSEGDSITLTVNSVIYSTQLTPEGKFTFLVDGTNLKDDLFTRLNFELLTSNGIELVSIINYLDYSITGSSNIFINFDEIGLIDFHSLPLGVTTYIIRGVVSGYFNTNDVIDITVNGNNYSTQCDMRGEFYCTLNLTDVLNSNFIEGVVTTYSGINSFKAYNKVSYETDYLNLDLSSINEHKDAYIEMQTLGNKTLVYDIDFGTSELVSEDYLIIPRSNVANWNSNVMIYFVPEDESTMTPDDFANPVPINSVSSPQWKRIIPSDPTAKELMRSERAKFVYDLFTGVHSGMDSGVIKHLCKLDEVNNKVTLVFSTPVSDIRYYQSNDPNDNPFTVSANSEYTNELLVRFSRVDSVVSFKTLIEGDIEIKIKLTHIEGFKFYLEETYRDRSNTYLVSLYASDRDYNGENIFIEDVINYSSSFIRCFVHVNNKIESGEYTSIMASKLEGEYLVTKGLEGENNLSDLTPYESSLEDLFTSDTELNLFITDVFNEKEYLDKLIPYLESSQVMAFTNIPDTILSPLDQVSTDLIEFSNRLDLFLVNNSKREYLIYCFGECFVDSLHYIPSSFYQARELIAGNFVGAIRDNLIASSLSDSERGILDKKFINYLEETDNSYNITYITNLPVYLEPIYLLASIYVKQSLTRYLHSKIGEYSMDIYFGLKQEILMIRNYTTLIRLLKINKFSIKSNTLNVIFDLELTGLVGKTLSINISLNIN